MIELSLAESVKKLKQIFSSVKVNEKVNPIEISISGKPVIVYAKNKCFVKIHNNIIAFIRMLVKHFFECNDIIFS